MMAHYEGARAGNHHHQQQQQHHYSTVMMELQGYCSVVMRQYRTDDDDDMWPIILCDAADALISAYVLYGNIPSSSSSVTAAAAPPACDADRMMALRPGATSTDAVVII